MVFVKLNAIHACKFWRKVYNVKHQENRKKRKDFEMKYKIEDLTAECYGYRWRKDGSLEWYACEWADIPKGALDSYTDAAGLLRLMEIEEAEAEEGLQS